MYYYSILYGVKLLFPWLFIIKSKLEDLKARVWIELPSHRIISHLIGD